MPPSKKRRGGGVKKINLGNKCKTSVGHSKKFKINPRKQKETSVLDFESITISFSPNKERNGAKRLHNAGAEVRGKITSSEKNAQPSSSQPTQETTIRRIIPLRAQSKERIKRKWNDYESGPINGRRKKKPLLSNSFDEIQNVSKTLSGSGSIPDQGQTAKKANLSNSASETPTEEKCLDKNETQAVPETPSYPRTRTAKSVSISSKSITGKNQLHRKQSHLGKNNSKLQSVNDRLSRSRSATNKTQTIEKASFDVESIIDKSLSVGQTSSSLTRSDKNEANNENISSSRSRIEDVSSSTNENQAFKKKSTFKVRKGRISLVKKAPVRNKEADIKINDSEDDIIVIKNYTANVAQNFPNQKVLEIDEKLKQVSQKRTRKKEQTLRTSVTKSGKLVKEAKVANTNVSAQPVSKRSVSLRNHHTIHSLDYKKPNLVLDFSAEEKIESTMRCIVYLGLGRPVHPSVFMNLKMQCSSDVEIDSNWAKIAVSAVKTPNRPPTISPFLIPIVCKQLNDCATKHFSFLCSMSCVNSRKLSETKSLCSNGSCCFDVGVNFLNNVSGVPNLSSIRGNVGHDFLSSSQPSDTKVVENANNQECKYIDKDNFKGCTNSTNSCDLNGIDIKSEPYSDSEHLSDGYIESHASSQTYKAKVKNNLWQTKRLENAKAKSARLKAARQKRRSAAPLQESHHEGQSKTEPKETLSNSSPSSSLNCVPLQIVNDFPKKASAIERPYEFYIKMSKLGSKGLYKSTLNRKESAKASIIAESFTDNCVSLNSAEEKLSQKENNIDFTSNIDKLTGSLEENQNHAMTSMCTIQPNIKMEVPKSLDSELRNITSTGAKRSKKRKRGRWGGRSQKGSKIMRRAFLAARLARKNDLKKQAEAHLSRPENKGSIMRKLSVPNEAQLEKDVLNTVENILDYVCAKEVFDEMELGYDEDYQPAPEDRPNVNGSTSDLSTERSSVRKDRCARELARLNVNVINLRDSVQDEPSVSCSSPEHCLKESCKFGCVCQSLTYKVASNLEHCAEEKCIFGCICDNFSANSLKSLAEAPSILTPLMKKLHIVSKRSFAVKEFRETVFVSKGNNKSKIFLNNTKRRDRKLPTRFKDHLIDVSAFMDVRTMMSAPAEDFDPTKNPVCNKKSALAEESKLVEKSEQIEKCVSTGKSGSAENSTPAKNVVSTELREPRKSFEKPLKTIAHGQSTKPAGIVSDLNCTKTPKVVIKKLKSEGRNFYCLIHKRRNCICLPQVQQEKLDERDENNIPPSTETFLLSGMQKKDMSDSNDCRRTCTAGTKYVVRNRKQIYLYQLLSREYQRLSSPFFHVCRWHSPQCGEFQLQDLSFKHLTQYIKYSNKKSTTHIPTLSDLLRASIKSSPSRLVCPSFSSAEGLTSFLDAEKQNSLNSSEAILPKSFPGSSESMAASQYFEGSEDTGSSIISNVCSIAPEEFEKLGRKEDETSSEISDEFVAMSADVSSQNLISAHHIAMNTKSNDSVLNSGLYLQEAYSNSSSDSLRYYLRDLLPSFSIRHQWLVFDLNQGFELVKISIRSNGAYVTQKVMKQDLLCKMSNHAQLRQTTIRYSLHEKTNHEGHCFSVFAVPGMPFLVFFGPFMRNDSMNLMPLQKISPTSLKPVPLKEIIVKYKLPRTQTVHDVLLVHEEIKSAAYDMFTRIQESFIYYYFWEPTPEPTPTDSTVLSTSLGSISISDTTSNKCLTKPLLRSVLDAPLPKPKSVQKSNPKMKASVSSLNSSYFKSSDITAKKSNSKPAAAVACRTRKLPAMLSDKQLLHMPVDEKYKHILRIEYEHCYAGSSSENGMCSPDDGDNPMSESIPSIPYSSDRTTMEAPLTFENNVAVETTVGECIDQCLDAENESNKAEALEVESTIDIAESPVLEESNDNHNPDAAPPGFITKYLLCSVEEVGFVEAYVSEISNQLIVNLSYMELNFDSVLSASEWLNNSLRKYIIFLPVDLKPKWQLVEKSGLPKNCKLFNTQRISKFTFLTEEGLKAEVKDSTASENGSESTTNVQNDGSEVTNAETHCNDNEESVETADFTVNDKSECENMAANKNSSALDEETGISSSAHDQSEQVICTSDSQSETPKESANMIGSCGSVVDSVVPKCGESGTLISNNNKLTEKTKESVTSNSSSRTVMNPLVKNYVESKVTGDNDDELEKLKESEVKNHSRMAQTEETVDPNISSHSNTAKLALKDKSDDHLHSNSQSSGSTISTIINQEDSSILNEQTSLLCSTHDQSKKAMNRSDNQSKKLEELKNKIRSKLEKTINEGDETENASLHDHHIATETTSVQLKSVNLSLCNTKLSTSVNSVIAEQDRTFDLSPVKTSKIRNFDDNTQSTSVIDIVDENIKSNDPLEVGEPMVIDLNGTTGPISDNIKNINSLSVNDTVINNENASTERVDDDSRKMDSLEVLDPVVNKRPVGENCSNIDQSAVNNSVLNDANDFAGSIDNSSNNSNIDIAISGEGNPAEQVDNESSDNNKDIIMNSDDDSSFIDPLEIEDQIPKSEDDSSEPLLITVPYSVVRVPKGRTESSRLLDSVSDNKDPRVKANNQKTGSAIVIIKTNAASVLSQYVENDPISALKPAQVNGNANPFIKSNVIISSRMSNQNAHPKPTMITNNKDSISNLKRLSKTFVSNRSNADKTNTIQRAFTLPRNKLQETNSTLYFESPKLFQNSSNVQTKQKVILPSQKKSLVVLNDSNPEPKSSSSKHDDAQSGKIVSDDLEIISLPARTSKKNAAFDARGKALFNALAKVKEYQSICEKSAKNFRKNKKVDTSALKIVKERKRRSDLRKLARDLLTVTTNKQLCFGHNSGDPISLHQILKMAKLEVDKQKVESEMLGIDQEIVAKKNKVLKNKMISLLSEDTNSPFMKEPIMRTFMSETHVFLRRLSKRITSRNEKILKQALEVSAPAEANLDHDDSDWTEGSFQFRYSVVDEQNSSMKSANNETESTRCESKFTSGETLASISDF